MRIPASPLDTAWPEAATVRVTLHGAPRYAITVGGPEDGVGRLAAGGGLVATTVVGEDGGRVLLVDCTTGAVLLEVSLAGTHDVSARLRDETLTVADDRGRILVFDLGSGALLRDVRL